MITSLKFSDQVRMIGICIIWIVAGILPIAVSEVSLSSTRSWYSEKERFVLTCTLPDFNKNIYLGNQKIPKIVECFAGSNCFLPISNTRYTAEKNGTTQLVLTISSFDHTQDTGEWNCTYIIDRQTMYSVFKVYLANGPKSVVLSPATLTYTVTEKTGSVGRITCTADCIPNCTMTWNGPNLPAGTSSELNLHNINRNQTGDYRCTARNSIGNLTSDIVLVIVNYGPISVVLTPSLLSYTVTEIKESVGPIYCTADCRPNCTLTWRGPYLAGSTASVLILQRINRNQAGDYQCEAVNSAGNLTSEILAVQVEYGPNSVILSPSTPSSYTVTETTGSVGPITCTADCRPNCTMTWSGPNLPGGTISELNLHNIKRNQTGDYRCTASNSVGNLTSNIVEVIVNYGPISVVLIPSTPSYTVTEILNSVGPIYCTAHCRPNCTIKWRGPNLAGGTAILYVQNISRNQAGDYRCNAANSAGNLTSEILKVHVNYGPNSVILSPSTPSSYIVTETTGSVGPITCTADCRPNCTMIWSGPNLPGGTTSVLNVHNIKRNQTGDYQCTAVNNISSQTSLKVTVIVNYGPSVVLLTPSTPSYTVIETEDSVGPIACTADCRPNCTMKWNGPNLPDGSTPVLNILNITRYQAGDYKCSVKNSIGSLVSRTITVIVNYVPTITSIDGNNIYAENDTATLHCQVDSIPKSTISWKFIDGSSATMLPIENEPTIKVNDTLLTVSQMSCLSMGLYICEASNDIGTAFKTLNITVMCAPKLNTIEYAIPKRIAVYENQALNITAPILAFPRPWIYWQFFQVNSIINISSENESTYNLNRHFSILYIENMTENKFGEYAIFAGNGVERTRSIGMFNVQAARRPNKPSHLNCSVGYNYIIFNWQPEFNGGSPQSFRIFYKNIQKQAFIGHPDIVSETEYHPVKIENLRPSSGYILKVHAINIFNKTESDEITCNTSREEVSKAESLIAVGVGTGVGAAVVIIISVLTIFFLYRQRRAKKTKNDKEPIKRINEEEEENDDLKNNPLYISSFDDAVSNVAIKDKVLKKKKQGNGKKSIEMAIVYENPDDFMNGNDQIYANQLNTDKSTTEYKPKENKDGLIYADLDLVPITEERKFVIHGMDNRNTYAIIDLSKKADPLSSDDEEEENADKKK